MSQNPWCYLDAPDLTRLDMAGVLIHQMLGARAYLVGSCMTREDFRDVDVRVMLDDDRYDALFPNGQTLPHPLQHIIEDWFDTFLVRQTGLRIDFQIQRRTEASAAYPNGYRHPLGVYISAFPPDVDEPVYARTTEPMYRQAETLVEAPAASA